MEGVHQQRSNAADRAYATTGFALPAPTTRPGPFSRTTTMVAPVASPTLIPRSPVFPRLLPLPPRPHPIPPAPSFQRRERFINYRDIWREMEELSDEEDAVEDQNTDIKTRGYNFLIPIGRTWTQHEEKNDVSTPSARQAS
ncbi:hypothetical protein BD310DRAFT_11348 [Dichomitus squalens]|uniref:Uncharacterized protein n=1 Tax=Dichomitus squalens TaxID=114155 RepID=A0A4Q9QCK3_9APHY|nr:hypothetical protein BD310DRAFT_11348 [Dichomitus squalens]